MIRLLARVHGPAHADHSWSDFAIIHLTPERLRKVFALYVGLLETRKKFPEVWSQNAWDGSPQWLAPQENDACDAELPTLNDPGYVFLSQDCSLGKDDPLTMNSECEELVVTAYEFYWQCYLKGTSYLHRTTQFEYQDFKNYLLHPPEDACPQSSQ